jgi:hypothetical protein
MQFGQLVTRSLSILLRHPYLWLLAILGGADVGAWGYMGPAPSASMSGTPSEPGRLTLGEVAPQVRHYVQDHLNVSAALLGILLLGHRLAPAIVYRHGRPSASVSRARRRAAVSP